MLLIVRLVGWLLVGIGAVHALRTWFLDRQLQQYRAPGAPLRAFLFVPSRWKEELYTPEGSEFIGKLWYALALMYIFALLGMLLIVLGTGSPTSAA